MSSACSGRYVREQEGSEREGQGKQLFPVETPVAGMVQRAGSINRGWGGRETEEPMKGKPQKSSAKTHTNPLESPMALFKEGRYDEGEVLARELTARFPREGFLWKALGQEQAARVCLETGSCTGEPAGVHHHQEGRGDELPARRPLCHAGIRSGTFHRDPVAAARNPHLFYPARSSPGDGSPAGWIARDDEDYVAKAVAYSIDLDRLASLRAPLRGQVLASPLFDAERFARHLEDALWGMWEEGKAMYA